MVFSTHPAVFTVVVENKVFAPLVFVGEEGDLDVEVVNTRGMIDCVVCATEDDVGDPDRLPDGFGSSCGGGTGVGGRWIRG